LANPMFISHLIECVSAMLCSLGTAKVLKIEIRNLNRCSGHRGE
jgi:hypothetical protein